MKSKQVFFIGKNLDPLHRGWVRVTVENEGEVELSFSTQVELLESKQNYQKILILEGYYKNCIAQLPYLVRKGDSSYSCLTQPLRLNNKLKLRVKGNYLTTNRKSSKIIVDCASLRKGVYRIGFPIKITKKINPVYLSEEKGGSRFAETWFPLITDNEIFVEKFIHFGSVSEGCVTIKYTPQLHTVNSWNQIYMKLITSRKADNTLAVLEVI